MHRLLATAAGFKSIIMTSQLTDPVTFLASWGLLARGCDDAAQLAVAAVAGTSLFELAYSDTAAGPPAHSCR